MFFHSPEQKKSNGLQHWIPSLSLVAEDDNDIEREKWLSDRVINAAQELLKSINIVPLVDFKIPLLAQNLQFTIE